MWNFIIVTLLAYSVLYSFYAILNKIKLVVIKDVLGSAVSSGAELCVSFFIVIKTYILT